MDAASIYEDVVPALAELKSMGIRLFVASSLSRRAAARFIERNSLGEFLSGVCTRDDAGGVKSAPLLSALARRVPSTREDDVSYGYRGGH